MICRPIPFKAPMVRALLAGTKTQTRRVVKYAEPDLVDADGWPLRDMAADGAGEVRAACPYGKPGDRLWVREAFRFPSTLDKLSPAAVGEKAIDAGYRSPWCPTYFEADSAFRGAWRGFLTPPAEAVPGNLRPGMFMPRWASRITLEVTGVRVERLQDISEADAVEEGIEQVMPGRWRIYGRETDGHDMDSSARTSYCSLWESINGPGSWSANPWVWVLSFKRVA